MCHELVATLGFRNLLSFSGLLEARVSDVVRAYDAEPQINRLVLGGGPVGVEMAQAG